MRQAWWPRNRSQREGQKARRRRVAPNQNAMFDARQNQRQKTKAATLKSTKDTWEEEAEVSLQKRLDGLLKSATTSSPSKATPRKTSAVEDLKTAQRINPSPITKAEDTMRKKRGSGTAVRAKHRVRSAKVSRGSQRNNPFMGSKDREMRKSRHKSANIVEHRKRMKKIWEQHHNLQRPPSRQRTPFPTHLAEFEFKRFKAFGKNQEIKSKVPTDPIAKSQIMQARKFAEESPRPPSRHRPPGESLFLNESENRVKQEEHCTEEGNGKDTADQSGNAKDSQVVYVDDLIMASKQSSNSSVAAATMEAQN